MPQSSTRETQASSENQPSRDVSLVIDVLICLFEARRALVCSHAVFVVRVFHLQNNGSSIETAIFCGVPEFNYYPAGLHGHTTYDTVVISFSVRNWGMNIHGDTTSIYCVEKPKNVTTSCMAMLTVFHLPLTACHILSHYS